MVENAEQHRRNRNPGPIQPNVVPMPLSGMANLQLWFLANSLDLNNSDPVAVWKDQSGNARDAVQASVASQPTFKTNVINGHPAVKFVSVQSLDFTPYVYSLSTWFIVWSRVNASANDVVLTYDATHYAYLQQSSLWYVYTAASTTVAMAADTFFLKSCVYDGVDYQRYTNGSAEASQSGVGAGEYRYIGAGAGLMNGNIAELVIFDTNLSAANRQFVENYLNAKYALW